MVFYRLDDRSPFIFAGVGEPEPDYSIEKPVKINWIFNSDKTSNNTSFTDEYSSGALYTEGTRTKVYVNRYERDRAARDACIKHHGTSCSVCNFDFKKVYGELGDGFIHVHHIVPLSQINSNYKVDPINDLIPVCPNCHSMLHRKGTRTTLEELRNLVKSN